ncbi:MAG: Smr/MutS family protein [Desulfobacterales bacterium]|nr:MAG: Smr/MutS family protein [Desulfobacterales bacterium]
MPFKDLKKLLKKKSFKLTPPSLTVNSERTCQKTDDSQHKAPKVDCLDVDQMVEDEKKMFLEAMADVKPIQRGDRVETYSTASLPIDNYVNSDDEALQELQQLVECGKGFVVSNTPEYIEGTGYNINPEFAKRLHRGDFSIQAHIDLHGLCVEDARTTFELFLKDSIMTGKRAVLVVHGRGLSSPHKPVLKTKVVEWLRCGPWRKWVIAFSSARSIDGGAGATYVLLRQRPVTRSQRKRGPS